MRIPFFALLFTACTSGETEESDTVGDADTDTDSDSDADTDVETPTGHVDGTVTDEAGDPVVGARVNFCRGTCVTAETDGDGRYVLEVDAQTGSFYVREDSHLLDAIVPLTVVEGVPRTIDITLFEADRTSALPATAAEVEILPGFRLTVGADTLEPPLFEELGEELFAASIAEADVLALDVEVAHGAFVAAYYFGPFESTAAAGLPFSIDNTFGLAADAPLVALAASAPDQYAWLPISDVAVSGNGSTIEGGSLPILTTLVLFQAE
jgi:hypothetical protein